MAELLNVPPQVMDCSSFVPHHRRVFMLVCTLGSVITARLHTLRVMLLSSSLYDTVSSAEGLGIGTRCMCCGAPKLFQRGGCTTFDLYSLSASLRHLRGGAVGCTSTTGSALDALVKAFYESAMRILVQRVRCMLRALRQ